MKLLPPADPHERAQPRPDRGTTFFVLPAGGILETQGDLSQSEAAARWDAEEAARRERYERDRATWLTPPPDRNPDLDRRRAAERAAWLEGHNAKWDAKEADANDRRLRERAAWAAKKRKRTKKRGKTAAAKRKAAWLERHAAKWKARLLSLRAARAAERAAWAAKHAAKWDAREAIYRARAAKKRAAWAAAHAEPPIPAEGTDPDVAREMWERRHAWETRRDRLLAPFRPRPFQAVIAVAGIPPATDAAARKPRPAPAARSECASRKQAEFRLMRRPWPVKSKAIQMGRALKKREQREIVELAPWRKLHVLRPQTRGECVDGPRPCPWVTCRMHLYTDVSPKSGSLKINFPGRSIEYTLHAMRDTCALDVADRGGTTLEEVGELINVSMERARQIQEPALGKTREQVDDDYMYEGGDEPEGDDDGTAW